MFKKNFERGFTLVELVIVMAILGILSAFLLPRFASFDTRARTASVSALAGSLRSAMAIVYSQSIVDGTASAATSSVTLEGQAITTAYGYPTGDAAGIVAAVSNLQGFTTSSGGTTPASEIFTLQANCLATYTQATSSAVATIGTTTSGC